MKKFKSSISLWLPVSVTLFVLVAISSCKQKKKYTYLAGTPNSVIISSFDINDNWVKSNFTDPKDPNFIETLDIVSSFDPVTNDFKVYLQGVRKDDQVVANSNIKLYEGNSCTPPPHTLIASHNYLKLVDLHIVKPDGQLENFNQIIFTPQVYSKNDMIMSYGISVDYPGTEPMAMVESFPCPPCYNCKPIPPGCEMPKDDTIMNNDKNIIIDSVKDR